MGTFLYNTWILVAIIGIILFLKIFFPKESYQQKIVLWLVWIAAIGFAFEFLAFLAFEDSFKFIPLLYCIICCVFIYNGGVKLAYKTMTGVVSEMNDQIVGNMKSGRLNWLTPGIEIPTIYPGGEPNTSADLQKLRVVIRETPLMRTAKRGIQARIKDITLVLELTEKNVSQLFDIEGGALTARELILSFVEEFFREEVAHITPEDLDTNGHHARQRLARKLKRELNDKFCPNNQLPYKIANEVIIGDTELQEEYYKALAEKEFALMKQDALNVDAEKLTERLVKMGAKLDPSGTPKEKLQAALISLGITKKEIRENTWHLNRDTGEILEAIAKIFKK